MIYAMILFLSIWHTAVGRDVRFMNPVIEQSLFLKDVAAKRQEALNSEVGCEAEPCPAETELNEGDGKADVTDAAAAGTETTDNSASEEPKGSETEITAIDLVKNEPEEKSDWEEIAIAEVTIYPTTTVNIRSLPSTEGDILAQVTYSDSLTAVAEVREYKGSKCFFYKLNDGRFISGDYVSFEKTEPITGNYVPVVKEGIEYYTCGNQITLPAGNYNIDTNYIGLKVIWTNKALLGTTTAKYTADTVNAVLLLQGAAGLPQTGVVDLATWLAMGYSEDDWNNLGTYITPMKVSAGATHQQCVDAMIQTSIEYMNAGTDYRIGCSGAPGTYADCSGFVFQLLYSIGVNPTINIVDHALAVKEYTSRDLCADDRLGLPVSYEDMQVGDIIFYSSNGYNVTHVAIYAGNGMMYDSNSGGVKLRGIWNRSTIVKIVRVCPD